jgi:hypothetical protein
MGQNPDGKPHTIVADALDLKKDGEVWPECYFHGHAWPPGLNNSARPYSAALYLRSQPLRQGSVYRVAIYAATNAYLATVTVTGREKISVRAGTYNAIKLNLQLKHIGKHLELEPHKKFRRATIWVSDDAERLILRIDAQIFVGTVFAELQSVRFDNPK